MVEQLIIGQTADVICRYGVFTHWVYEAPQRVFLVSSPLDGGLGQVVFIMKRVSLPID